MFHFPVVCLFVVVNSYLTTLNYTYEEEGSGNSTVLQFTSYYNTDLKRPNQIFFEYTCQQARRAVNQSSPKRPHFTSDPRLPITDQAVDADYKGSGLTRGHLGTAKYFCYNRQSYHNTFFLTNVAPQYQKANQLWNIKDEVIILDWAANNSNCIDKIMIDIATFGENGTIGEDKVSIPNVYVNSVCEPHTGNSVCFIGTNQGEDDKVWYGDVDTCEQMYSFKFFNVPQMAEYVKCNENKDKVNEQFWNIHQYHPITSKFLRRMR